MEEGSEEEESQRDNTRKSEERERVIWFILPAVNLVHEAAVKLVHEAAGGLVATT